MKQVEEILCDDCAEPAVARLVSTGEPVCLRHCCARLVTNLHVRAPRQPRQQPANAQMELLP